MLRLLVDTCVWLDLAKTPSQSKNLDIIENLKRDEFIDLIVPQTVIDEFCRNEGRVIDEYAKSISSTLSRAREIVVQLGDKRRVRSALKLFNDAGYKIRTPKEVATHTATRIELMLRASDVIEASDAIKLRASERAIQKKAPFHRNKNSMDDAILIESYCAFIAERGKPKDRFAFVTHNHADFSDPTGSHKLPHPDMAGLFSKIKSRYFITLREALSTVMSTRTHEWQSESYEERIRGVSEIGGRMSWLRRFGTIDIK